MVQKASCSLAAKCQNNHPTAIFQPDRCQGSTAGNASNMGSQLSRSPSQTSTVSAALWVLETNSDSHRESLSNSFEEPSTSIDSSQPREASPDFPSASSSRKRQTVYHRSSSGVLAVMEDEGHCSSHSLAHSKAGFSENM